MKPRNNLEQLHRELLDDPDYELRFAEETLIHRVAQHLVQLREWKGLTQAELAERIGTKQPSIAKIEGGYTNLTLRKLARIAFALEEDPVALVAGDVDQLTLFHESVDYCNVVARTFYHETVTVTFDESPLDEDQLAGLQEAA